MPDPKPNRDTLYSLPRETVEPFRFDARVAEVFDDMAARSIPQYAAMHEATANLSRHFHNGRAAVLDLGCSTGSMLIHASLALNDANARFVGLDSSESMVHKCREKLSGYRLPGNFTFIASDLLDWKMETSEIVYLHFVLQFLKPQDKLVALTRIAQSLLPEGVLFLSEKIRQEDPRLESCFTEAHFDFKRNRGYSRLEIAQKRDALEDVLLPNTLSELSLLLKQAGFSRSQVYFQWLNFASILAIR